MTDVTDKPGAGLTEADLAALVDEVGAEQHRLRAGLCMRTQPRQRVRFDQRIGVDERQPARIGHGIRAIEDAQLVRDLAERAVTLEVCPGSNAALGLYPVLRFHPVNLLRRPPNKHG